MSEQTKARWYVIHTYSGYENKVMTDLEKMVENRGMQELVQEFRIPTETVTEIQDGKEKEYVRKVFPGYVFVKMIVTEESWFVVRNIHGVTGFVGPGSDPVPLTAKEVKNLGIEGCDAQKRSVEVGFSIGDTVKIISGPLEGFQGVVATLDEGNKRATITISLAGKDTPVDVEINQLASADKD